MRRRLQQSAAILLLVVGCDSGVVHPGSASVEVAVKDSHSLSGLAEPEGVEMCSVSRIFPRVVHREYFDASGVVDIDTEPERFGFVRPLGNDVFTFRAYADDRVIRNVHQEHLDRLQLSLADANRIAMENLRRIAFAGKTIRQHITETGTGNDWGFWLGNELTPFRAERFERVLSILDAP